MKKFQQAGALYEKMTAGNCKFFINRGGIRFDNRFKKG